MGAYINKGNSGFAKYAGDEYVDKTEMIAFVNATLETANMLTCVTRPRRFGKSMAANMLYAYYDKSCDSSELFDSFVIARDKTYEEHLNRYPSIYVDMTRFVSDNRGKKDIVRIVQRAIKSDLAAAYPDIKIARNATLMDTLFTIATQTGQKFIFIIDEWDALCRELADKPQVMDEYVDLLRSMFKSNDTAIVFAGVYMTGILPIKKYGTQSALNDFREYSMTKSGAMGGFLGFTDSDVRMLAEKYGMNYAELKRWYDGYELDSFDWRQNIPEIKKVAIYNPNSVMTAIRDHKCDNYWSKSEAFEALQQYIDMDFDGVRETLENLVQGNPVYLRAMRYGNDLNSIESNDELFTLLTHFGYLSYNQDTRYATLPNQEIREEFIEALRGSSSHKELQQLVRTSDKLLESTWVMDEEAVAKGIEELHNHKTAPNFYNNEQALRSVVRMAYLGAIDFYIDIQELPSGKGYCDIAFLPRRGSGKPAMVVELKWNDSVASAINQIKNQDYPALLADYSGDVILVAITYDYTEGRNENSKKHSCMIERYHK